METLDFMSEANIASGGIKSVACFIRSYSILYSKLFVHFIFRTANWQVSTQAQDENRKRKT